MKKKLISILIANLFVAAPVFAQDAFKVEGSVSVGGITVDENDAKDASKLNELRDLSDGGMLGFDLRGRGGRYWFDLFGENLGRDDHYVNLRGGIYDVLSTACQRPAQAQLPFRRQDAVRGRRQHRQHGVGFPCSTRRPGTRSTRATSGATTAATSSSRAPRPGTSAPDGKPGHHERHEDRLLLAGHEPRQRLRGLLFPTDTRRRTRSSRPATTPRRCTSWCRG